MARVQPIPIPAQLLERFGVTPADSATAEFKYTHRDVQFTADGQYMITLSHIYAGTKPWRSIDSMTLGCSVITRYGPDGTPVAAAIGACADEDGNPSRLERRVDATVCALPDGTVTISNHNDHTYLLAEDLSAVHAAYTQPVDVPPAERDGLVPNSFVSAIRRTPGGRLLCVAEEWDVYYYGSTRSLLGIADDPLTSTSRPMVTTFAALDDRIERQTPHHQRPYLLFESSPVFGAHRPQPTLAALVPRGEETSWMSPDRPPTLHTPEPLADDRFVVPLFSKTLRSGGRGLPFVFAILDDTGKLHGRLEGLDPYRHSPFAGQHDRVTTDPGRGLVYHLNRSGLFIWAGDGTLLAHLDTGIKEFGPLTHFELRGCAPDGDLVLVHPKQHLLLRIPIHNPNDPRPSVLEAIHQYPRQRTALKKAHTPTGWGWTWEPDQLHYL
ncbi:hypothetical protein ACWDOP_03145 [Nocardia sp. NPDC003693]